MAGDFLQSTMVEAIAVGPLPYTDCSRSFGIRSRL
jgi:hypothetical protein